jgi:hypothetical protein
MLECRGPRPFDIPPFQYSNIPTSRFYVVRNREVILRSPLSSIEQTEELLFRRQVPQRSQ